MWEGFNIKNTTLDKVYIDNNKKHNSVKEAYLEHVALNENIINQMEKWFLQRTRTHIELVKKYWMLLSDTHKNNNHILNHDILKFSEPEFTPYLYISWDYKCKADGVPYEIPNDMKDSCNKATVHHITHSKHHPEAWDENFNLENFNMNNRDKPGSDMVDGTNMPTKYLMEMCCDWCSVSEERGTNPFDWAKNNINIRWKFNSGQEEFIYNILKQIWK